MARWEKPLTEAFLDTVPEAMREALLRAYRAGRGENDEEEEA